jgi:undecaprenyl diphosphate synthase
MVLTVAFDYGSRAELMTAVERARRAGPVTPESIAAHLYLPELPHVDVMVRTSGERRVSNFLLWQSAGSKIHFTDSAWPDFDAADLDAAIALVRSV